jgi:hypothetical protein
VAEGYVQPHPREFVLPAGSLTLVIDLDVENAERFPFVRSVRL